MVVYITEQGAVVSKRRGVIVVAKGPHVLQTIHLHGLEQLVLLGQIQISTQALRALLQAGTETVLLTMTGKFLGRLSSGLSRNIGLRRLQFHKLDRTDEIVAFCRCCVKGKLENYLTLLRRHNRTLKSETIARDAAGIRHCLQELPTATTPNIIRGLEGAGSARYFSALRSIFRAPGLAFFRRARRPPPDPINILLSLGYTILTNLVHSICEAAGLDPYLGALHTPRYGRPSLALDLIEEFRPVIVDATAIRVINTRAITANDFHHARAEEALEDDESEGDDGTAAYDDEQKDMEPGEPPPEDQSDDDESDEIKIPDPEEPLMEAAPPARAVVISNAGLKKWLLALERRLEEKVFYEGKNVRLSYRQILREQVYRFARQLKGDGKYQPFLLRY